MRLFFVKGMVKDGPVNYFDGEECESRDDFLNRTFDLLSHKLERSLSDDVGFEANIFADFYRNQYAEIMQQENADEEFFNYEELLTCPKDVGQLEWILCLAVREFMLRLRLPNDGPTEERVLANLKKLIG